MTTELNNENKNEKENETMNTIFDEVKAILTEMKRDDEVLDVRGIYKNNVVKHGVSLRKENENIAPTVYIENYMNENSDALEIAKSILITLRGNTDNGIKQANDIVNIIKDYDEVSSYLKLRLVNRKANEANLKAEGVIFDYFLDDLIIYVVAEFEMDKGGYSSVKIKESMAEMWGGVDIKMVMHRAKANTNGEFPNVQNIGNVLNMLGVNTDDINVPMLVMTNATKIYGAVKMINRYQLSKIAKGIGTDKLYILPSSVHEVLILPNSKDIDIRELTDMVQTVNATEVADEEVLSDHVYIFDATMEDFVTE